MTRTVRDQGRKTNFITEQTSVSTLNGVSPTQTVTWKLDGTTPMNVLQLRKSRNSNLVWSFQFDITDNSTVPTIRASLGVPTHAAKVKSAATRNFNAPWTSCAPQRQSLLASLEEQLVRAALVPRSARNKVGCAQAKSRFPFVNGRLRARDA